MNRQLEDHAHYQSPLQDQKHYGHTGIYLSNILSIYVSNTHQCIQFGNKT